MLSFAFRESWSNVAVPIIDSIDPDTFKYKASPLGKSSFFLIVFYLYKNKCNLSYLLLILLAASNYIKDMLEIYCFFLK